MKTVLINTYSENETEMHMLAQKRICELFFTKILGELNNFDVFKFDTKYYDDNCFLRKTEDDYDNSKETSYFMTSNARIINDNVFENKNNSSDSNVVKDFVTYRCHYYEADAVDSINDINFGILFEFSSPIPNETPHYLYNSKAIHCHCCIEKGDKIKHHYMPFEPTGMEDVIVDVVKWSKEWLKNFTYGEEKDPVEEIKYILDGTKYPDVFDKIDEHADYLLEHDLLVVLGCSDDLMEFRGIINDEVDCFNGGEVHFSKDGFILENAGDRYIENFEELKKTAVNTIEAIWCDEQIKNVAWTYHSDIPHSLFAVYEDDGVYCLGIIIKGSDLK